MKFILKKSDLHIANIFSIFAFIIALWWNYVIFKYNIFLGICIILIASIFDIFDWFLARKYDSKSKIWAFLDSFSDIFIYLIPIFIIYLKIYSFSFLFLFSSSFLVFTSLFRLSLFMKKWFELYKNKKYYIWMPIYFLFILNIIILLKINYIFINLFIFLFSLFMILNIKFRKFWIFISILYIFIISIFYYLLYLWIF